MKKLFLTFCLTIPFVLVITSCSYTQESKLDNEKPNKEAEIVEDSEFNSENKFEDNYNDYSEIPVVGGSDYSFSRKFADEVYNIQIAAEVVGEEKRNEWVNNVFLKKSVEEQSATPTLYQMIVDLNIAKDDLIRKNNEYIDYPDQYIPMEIIDSLYQDDIEAVKKELKNPLALYYNGEIYTFNELKNSGKIIIPSNILEEYFDYIEVVCERNGLMKEMQEEIVAARKNHIAKEEIIK